MGCPSGRLLFSYVVLAPSVCVCARVRVRVHAVRAVGMTVWYLLNLTAKVDVINRGFSGYNTRMALYLLNKVFTLDGSGNAPLFATVFFGANDSAYPPNTQHVPLEEFISNTKAIVSHISKVCKTVVLITPPAFYHSAWKQCCIDNNRPPVSANRSDELAGKYASAVVEIAKELGVHYIDLWSEMHNLKPQGDEWKVYLSDGLHLSRDGNAILFHLLKKIIEGVPSISANNLAMYGGEAPLWSDVNMENPSLSIK